MPVVLDALQDAGGEGASPHHDSPAIPPEEGGGSPRLEKLHPSGVEVDTGDIQGSQRLVSGLAEQGAVDEPQGSVKAEARLAELKGGER